MPGSAPHTPFPRPTRPGAPQYPPLRPPCAGALFDAMIRLPCLALALPVALALPLPALAGSADWPQGRVLAALSGDWNGDGEGDLVVLADGGGGTADILIHEGDLSGLPLTHHIPGAVFAGPMAGQRPRLKAHSDSSFIIEIEQIGIGRSPWMQRLTIAHRDGDYVVAGFTHRFYDRLDPERSGHCDVNLLTGAWEGKFAPATGQPARRHSGRDGPRAFPLSALHEDYFPQICHDLFAE